jgi:signal transduction histidine kinase
MQQTDSLRETAHKPEGPAITAAMMTAAIGSAVPRSTDGSTHEPKAKTASHASLASPTSEDARVHEPGRIAPEHIRTSPNLLSPNLMSPNLMHAPSLAATLATLRSESETLTEVAHDARNMVTALGLYCEFLEEPGVLATPFQHYGQELRLVAAASRRLVEKIVALNAQSDAQSSAQTRANISAQAAEKLAILASGLTPAGLRPSELGGAAEDTQPGDAEAGAAQQRRTATAVRGTQRESGAFSNPNRRWDLLPTVPVANLAAELAVNRNLLAALAGPSIALTVHAEGCARPVWLSGEDLTRVLVNLVKNSAEAMHSGGRIDIGLREIGLREHPSEQAHEHAPEHLPEHANDQDAAHCLLLTVEDNGPGIPAEAEETIFAYGFTSHGVREGQSQGSANIWPLGHRGLGLTISRSIVEGAGGRITAANREQGGARFRLELPLRQAT